MNNSNNNFKNNFKNKNKIRIYKYKNQKNKINNYSKL